MPIVTFGSSQADALVRRLGNVIDSNGLQAGWYFGEGQGIPFSNRYIPESGQRSKAPHQTGCEGTRHLAWRVA